jgi:hypothetical protein
MRYPNVYLVGAPKCGTTSLHYYLGQHPLVFAPGFKEPHYHTVAKTGLPTWGVKNLEQYLTLYSEARPEQTLLDASAWNLYAPDSAKFISETCPDAYIIISLRHPVRRAYSHFMHMVQRGWEKYYLFEDAIAQEEQRIDAGAFWDVHYLSVGYYAKQVQRYLEHFPRKQIKILIFEEWTQKPEVVIQELFDFVGLQDLDSLQIQKAKNITQISYAQMLRIYLQRYKEIKQIVQSLLPQNSKQALMNWLQHKRAKSLPALDVDFEMNLMCCYLEDIKMLEGLLGYSIDAW